MTGTTGNDLAGNEAPTEGQEGNEMLKFCAIYVEGGMVGSICHRTSAPLDELKVRSRIAVTLFHHRKGEWVDPDDVEILDLTVIPGGYGDGRAGEARWVEERLKFLEDTGVLTSAGS